MPSGSQINGLPIEGFVSNGNNLAGGTLALVNNTTGDYNTAIGANAGKISNGDNKNLTRLKI